MSDLNDPRVLFAAERTLLAWNRTCISLMTFGFVIERFGLFLKFAGREEVKVFQRQISFFIGIGFILLATGLVLYSVIQYRRTVRSLKPVEIPERYNVRVPVIANSIIGLLGLLLSIYLFRGIT